MAGEHGAQKACGAGRQQTRRPAPGAAAAQGGQQQRQHDPQVCRQAQPAGLCGDLQEAVVSVLMGRLPGVGFRWAVKVSQLPVEQAGPQSQPRVTPCRLEGGLPHRQAIGSHVLTEEARGSDSPQGQTNRAALQEEGPERQQNQAHTDGRHGQSSLAAAAMQPAHGSGPCCNQHSCRQADLGAAEKQHPQGQGSADHAGGASSACGGVCHERCAHPQGHQQVRCIGIAVLDEAAHKGPLVVVTGPPGDGSIDSCAGRSGEPAGCRPPPGHRMGQ